MMSEHILTANQSRKIDQITIHRYGIPGIILMERAGRAAAEEVLLVAKKRHNANARPKVAVFCGKGKNGGDGLVCARYLLSAGLDVQVYFLCSKNKLKGDAKTKSISFLTLLQYHLSRNVLDSSCCSAMLYLRTNLLYISRNIASFSSAYSASFISMRYTLYLNAGLGKF